MIVGLNGNLLYSKNTMTHFWANADNGMYNVYPGSMSEMTDLMFFIDPYFKYYGAKDYSHTVKGRAMYSDNWATNNQDGQSRMYYLEYQYAKQFKKLANIQIFAGAVGQLTCSWGNVFSGLVDSTQKAYPKNAANAAGYLQLEKKFLKKQNLTLLGGARYEYFRIYEPGRPADDSLNTNYEEARPVFRAGINYQITQTHTSFRASFGQGYRFPSIGERYIMLKVGNYGFYPNPNLKSETSWNVEAGIQQLFKFWAFQGVFDVAGYYQRYNNYVEFFMGPWNPDPNETSALKKFGFKFFNTGPAQIMGIDASLGGEAQLGKKVKMTVYLAYTYSQPKVLDTSYVFTDTAVSGAYNFRNTSSDTATQIMKYRLEHVMKADLSLTIFNIFTVGASAQYYSMMRNVDNFFYDFDRFSPSAGKWIATSRSPYPFDGLSKYREAHKKGTTIVGLYASVEMWNVKLSLIVSNLLNTEYSLRPMAPEAPRVTTIQFMYKFTEGEPFFPKRKKSS
jgi:iron complex outermembrane receptor protein